MELQSVLKEVLPEKVAHPGTELYEKSNGEYFTLFASAIKPAFIAQPTSAQEVSTLVKKLHPKLVNGETKMAVRGTGHTPFAGSANIDNGVTVDLRGLKGIKLSGDKSSVTIGVGETWGSVYAELGKDNVTTPGGRVGRVGVGGLILGGGMSFFSTKHGFACDSVIDFEVVLASGEIIHANTSENSDLLVALRGGLNNFGIVTSFTMKTIPNRNMWGGVGFYMPDSFPQLIQTTVDFVLNEKDEDTHIMSSAGFGFGQQVTTCCMYHTEGQENAPSLEGFTSLPGKIDAYSTLRTATPIAFCDELSKFTADGVRTFYATLTIKPDVPLMKELYGIWQTILETIKDAEGLTFSLGYFPLTKGLLTNSRDAGGNAKDIDPADGPLFIILINPTWNSAADDARIHSAVEDLLAKFRETASAKNLLHRYIFTNYAYEKDSPLVGYGEASLQRLKETSNKYDPEGIFQTAVPGGFKLSKA